MNESSPHSPARQKRTGQADAPTGRPGPRHGVARVLARGVLSSVCVLVFALVGTLSRAQSPEAGKLGSKTRAQIDAIAKANGSRTSVQRKIAFSLFLARQEFLGRTAVPAAPELRSGVPVLHDGRCRVRLSAAVNPALVAEIGTLGGRVLGSYPADGAVYALVPLGDLETLAARADVKFIGIPPRAIRGSGSGGARLRPPPAGDERSATAPDVNDPEGDRTHGTDTVRAQHTFNWTNIKIGVISDSIDDDEGSYAAALAAHYVFSVSDVTPGGKAGPGSGEGLAMCEIVHRLAPGAQLFFAADGGTEEQMAAGVQALKTAGCAIIADDVAFTDESPFQDSGLVAQAVNTVCGQGVLYFASAGNSYNLDGETVAGTGAYSSCWEGDFVSPGDGWLDFNQGRGAVLERNLVQSRLGNVTVSLFWAEPTPGATSQYNLVEYNAAGNVVRVAANDVSVTGKPVQVLDGVVPGDYVAVQLQSGNPRFVHLDISDPLSYLNTATAGRVRGHNSASAANAFCVAATPANAPYAPGYPQPHNLAPPGPYPNLFGGSNGIEVNSADGPRRIFFNADGSAITAGNFGSAGGRVLAKPDFAAADGVTTSLPVDSGFHVFYGTSAAAPHAAALAALLLAFNGSGTLTPAQAATALRNGCIQVANPGAGNRDAGNGILLATKLIGAPAGATAPVITSGAGDEGTVGDAFTYQITANQVPTSYGASGLPAGLAVNTSSGLISGVPGKTGVYVVTIMASNGQGAGSAQLKLVIEPVTPEITSAGSASGKVGAAFGYQIKASGAPTNYAVAGLPPGLKVNAQSGLISGTPRQMGAWSPILIAVNGTGTGAMMLDLSIAQGVPVITSSLNVPGRQGVAFGYQITATNTPGSYGASGLPAGLGVNAATGRISGTPGKAGTYTVTLKAINGSGTGTTALILVVKPPA